MESVALKRGMVVGMTHEPFDYAYFPIDAVISLAGTTLDGLSVEIGMVPHEGYLGLPILFGKRIHLYEATVQHHGSALRVPGGVLEDALHASRTRYEQLLRYSTVRFVQLGFRPPFVVASIPSNSADGYSPCTIACESTKSS
jgi:hypothetical protein